MLERILLLYCRGVRYIVKRIGESVSYLMPVLAGIVAFEVFARYILDAPTIWAYDVSLFLFGYISALGGAYAQQKGSHINVDIFYATVPEKVQRLFNLVTGILAIGFLLIMVKTCGEHFLESLKLNYRTQSEWAPAVHHFWLMITVSAAIFVAEYSVQFIDNLFYLLTGRMLVLDDSEFESAMAEQPFKVDSTKVVMKAKESANEY
ncbi:TRAP transporter small permease [Vibrio sp. HA2012]|uniref:TRAP transporter small permease subunit n=1 Tax=Vibrio sp. HA2012 TaxID=1971595 RepID=UPI000C2BA163|nr:TRAP transporter small permease [Vibrio sp. HA2012]PJC85600.1 TRAP transporter small permease [Vibrio sp. HA2012]